MNKLSFLMLASAVLVTQSAWANPDKAHTWKCWAICGDISSGVPKQETNGQAVIIQDKGTDPDELMKKMGKNCNNSGGNLEHDYVTGVGGIMIPVPAVTENSCLRRD